MRLKVTNYYGFCVVRFLIMPVFKMIVTGAVLLQMLKTLFSRTQDANATPSRVILKHIHMPDILGHRETSGIV